MIMLAQRFITILLFTVAVTCSVAQRTEKYDGEYASFYKAEDLFEKEQYSAARATFAQFLDSFEDKNDPLFVKARYYEGLSALHLYNNDAVKLLQEFINEYPESIYKNDIYLKIGKYFYQRKKYTDAVVWLKKTDRTDVEAHQLTEYYFKLGYAHFQLGEYRAARNAFYEIKDDSSNYAAPALYYYSHIAYQNETYQEALGGFLKLLSHPTFKDEVPYYIAQIYYLLGDYEKLTEFAPELVSEDKEPRTPEMNLLVGDAYYRIKKYDEAAEYLETYDGSSETTREQDYALAFAYFKSQQYEAAIPVFDRVTRKEDQLTQTAYYHIAECYKKTDQLNYARTAFKSAAGLDYDAETQEDALYNYAVLSYELDYNPYNEAIEAFELFLEKFPRSKRREDVYSYLVNVYSNTKRYKEALQSLDRIDDLNIQLKTAYQIVAFNMGIERFERGAYQSAIQALKRVNKYPVNSEISGIALFWTADAHYRLTDYTNAIKVFRDFLSIPGINDQQMKHNAYYNIAYAYYKQEDWVQAIQAFRTYTQLSDIQDENRLADAYTRIGDCYYTREEPDFEKSAMNYEKALNYDAENKDRVLYALAKVYGFRSGKRQERIATLLDIINNYSGSSYVIPAIFDVGMSYKNAGNNEKALQYFNQIVNDYPNNILVQDALIEIADLNYKQKNYTESESYFRRVLNEFSLNDEMCKRATQGLIDIYKATRKQNEVTKLRKEFACAEISEDDEEVIFYEAANELYLNENYEEAVPELKKYLERYPDGRFTIQLLSYLADIYYQRGEEEKALEYYEQIIERPKSSYTEEALVRASKTLYNDGEYERALPYYDQLEDLASTAQVIFNTRVGLMRCNYLLEHYANAAEIAQKVLDDELLGDDDKRIEANYIAGVSLFYTEAYETSKTYLRWTADNTGKERGTEALHTLAEAHYHQDEYDKAEKIHEELMKRKPAYDYWIAKSLILQARVFQARDELFQAEKTIDLVLSNYPDKEDDVIKEAQSVKDEIMQLKDASKSIEDNGNRKIDINEGDDD
ncbi:MAG: tetratricopeptide repeat protein [Bacteroidota bacterium]